METLSEIHFTNETTTLTISITDITAGIPLKRFLIQEIFDDLLIFMN